MTKIFISRKLEKNSPFLQKMVNLDVEITDRSLIQFNAIPFGALAKTDWLFFYSKKGIQYFFENYSTKKKLTKIAVIGQASASFLFNNYNIKPDWIGSGIPKTTAIDFEPIAKGQKVLFIQAKNSKQSIQKLLQNKIQGLSLVVYNNQAKTDFDLPLVDILVFTSPLNIKAYFNKYPYIATQKIICIGTSTASELKQYAINNYYIAKEPSLSALADACIAHTK